MTFALGLASVWFINGSRYGLIEVPVNLPQTKSGEVIMVFPKYSSEIPCCTGASGGGYKNEMRHRSQASH
jgi:hypothetical protein